MAVTAEDLKLELKRRMLREELRRRYAAPPTHTTPGFTPPFGGAFAAPKEQVGAAFVAGTKKAWEQGEKSAALDFLWNDVRAGRIPEEEAIKAEQEHARLVQENPHKARNFLESVWQKTVSILPPMVQSYKKGAKEGLVTAAALGAAGQAVPLPEEIVTVPGGFKVGLMHGTMRYWTQQGMGEIYRTARRLGASPETANAAAQLGGPVYAALEYSQVSKFVPKGAKKTLVRGLISYVADVAENVGQEGLQKIVTEGAATTAAVVDGAVKKSELPDETKRILKEGLQESLGSIGPMALLRAPGLGVDVALADVGPTRTRLEDFRDAQPAEIIEMLGGQPTQREMMGAYRPKIVTEPDVVGERRGGLTMAEVQEFPPPSAPETLNPVYKESLDTTIKEIYSDLVSRAEQGDVDAINRFRELQSAAMFPTYEELRSRAAGGDKVAAKHLEEGLYAGREKARQMAWTEAAKEVYKTRGPLDPEYVEEVAARQPDVEMTPDSKPNVSKEARRAIPELGEVWTRKEIDSVTKAADPILLEWSKKVETKSKAEMEAALKELRAKQAEAVKGKLRSFIKSKMPLGKKLRAAKKEAAIIMDVPAFDPPPLTDTQWEGYIQKAADIYKGEDIWRLENVNDAFDRIRNGQALRPFEWDLVKPVFGQTTTTQLYAALNPKAPWTVWDLYPDVQAALKFAISFDPGYFRQAIKTAPRHPVLYVKHMKEAMDVYVHPEKAEMYQRKLEQDPDYQEAKMSGDKPSEVGIAFLSANPWGEEGGKIRLDYFNTDLQERMVRWGIRKDGTFKKGGSMFIRFIGRMLQRSNLSTCTGTNAHMLGMYKSRKLKLQKQLKAGKLTKQEYLEALWETKRHINNSNKAFRSNLKQANEARRAANHLIYSFNNLVSTPLQIVDLCRSKHTRAYAGQMLAADISLVWGYLGLGKIAEMVYRRLNPDEEPPIKVEMNPLSPKFGLYIGNTRIDLSFGSMILWRTVVRIGFAIYAKSEEAATGKVRSEILGQPVPTAGGTALSYLETRQAPAISFAKQLLSGKDYAGNPTGVPETILRAITPEQAQAMYEALDAEGFFEAIKSGDMEGITKGALTGTAATGAAAVGAGTLSYKPNPYFLRKEFQDKIAMDRYGKRWSDINKPQRMMLELLHETTFKRLEREIKSDRRVYSNEKALNEAKKAEKFVRRRLTKEAKSIYKDFSLDLSRNQGDEALNDEQYNEWISAFAEELNKIAWAIPNLSEDRQDEWVNIARKKTLNAIQEKYKLKIPR